MAGVHHFSHPVEECQCAFCVSGNEWDQTYMELERVMQLREGDHGETENERLRTWEIELHDKLDHIHASIMKANGYR